MEFEYRVVAAPKRLKKVRGASTEDAFVATLADAINAEARQGWEYLRSETLAVAATRGLFRRSVTVEETVLVFRRPRSGPRLAQVPHEVLPEPEVRAAEPRNQPRSAVPEPALRAPAAGRSEPGLRSSNGAIRSSTQRAEGEAGPSLLRPVPRVRPNEPG
jgi:hypothetical protein